METKVDVFDRIVRCMDELLTMSEADLVTVNISTKENRIITLTIQSDEPTEKRTDYNDDFR